MAKLSKMISEKKSEVEKILDGYIDFLINIDYSTFEDSNKGVALSTSDDSYKGVTLRLGTTFFDRVRTAYKTNTEYNGKSVVTIVDSLNLKPLNEFDDKIEYLFDLLKVLTHKDHKLLNFMFFGTDHIKSDISKKIKR